MKLRRLYTEERLQVRRRGGRKQALGHAGTDGLCRRAPTAQRWSLDFAFGHADRRAAVPNSRESGG